MIAHDQLEAMNLLLELHKLCIYYVCDCDCDYWIERHISTHSLLDHVSCSNILLDCMSYFDIY